MTWKLLQPLLVVFGLFLLIGSLQAQGETSPDCDEEFQIYRAADATLDNANLNYQLSQDDKWTWETVLADPHIGDDYEQLIVEYELPLMCKSASGMAEPICEFTFQWLADRYRENREAARGGLSTAQSSVELWRGRVAAAQLEESVASLRLMACQTGSETSLEAAISAGFAISEPTFQDEVARAVNEHIRVGMVAYNSGDSGAALSRFEQAASMARPISPRAAAIVRYYKGNIYAGLGQWTSAIAEYNTAITLADPSPALYYYARGVVQTYLPDQQAGYEGAINDYLTALALEPGNPLYFFALGSAYTHLGRWAEALEALRQYVRLSQNDDPLILDYLDALVALVGYDIDDELTQTWITGLRQDDHGIAIRIPSSWDAREVAVTDGSGFLSPRHYEFYLSNSEFPALWVPPLNPGAGLQLVTGEVRVYVAAYPTQTLNPNVSADATPIEVIAVANDNPDPEVLLEGPTEVSLGGKRAAYLVQRVPGTSFTRIFIAVELGEGMTAFMITYANLDEWEQFFDVILTIAATMNYAVDPQPISLDMDAEGDPNDPGATPTPVPLVMNSISYGETKDGVLTTTGSSFYQFNGSAGDEVTITLNSTDFDPLLELQNGSDTQIASNDNFDGSNTQISLVLPETGAYKIVVRSLNSGASGRFQLALVLNSAGNPIPEPTVEAEGLPPGALDAISDRMNPPDQPYSVTSTVRLTENIEIPLLSASAFGATLSENLIVLGESSDSYCVVVDRPLSLDLKGYDISILGHMLIVDLGGASSPIPTHESHFLIQREITPEILEYLDDPWRVIPASAMSGLERDWNDICGYRTGDAQYYVIPPTATPTSTPTPLPTATPVAGLSGILLFVRDNDIYRLETSGTETRLTDTPDVYKTALAISPRGDMVAYIANDSSQHTMMSSHADSITVLEVNTGRTRNLTDPIDRQGFSRVLDGLAWSPDGTHIAFTEIARGENHVAISVVSAGAERTGTDTRIGVGDLGYTTYGNPAWSADGTRVYAITDGCSAACIRSFAADGRGEPVDVLPSDLSADILAFNLAVSPDGTKLAFYRLENDFYYVTVYDFASQQLILTQVQPRTDRFGLAWSPDGRQILTSAIDGLQNIPNAFGELYAFTPVDGPATDAIQITDDQAWGGAWLEPGTVVSVSPTPTVESDAPRESEAAISGRWEGSVDEGGLGYTTALSLNQCFPNQIVCGGATYSAGGCQAAISLISRDGNTIQLSQQGITGICHDAIITLKPIDAQTWSAVYVADGGFRSGEQFAEAQLTASRLSGFDHLSTPVPTFTPTWTASAFATIQPTATQTASSELLPTSVTESVSANQFQQWATRAEASSEYSGSRWSAAQATGEPNTGACGDFDTAWASQTGTGRDRLTVYFDTPVIAERVNIYQTYNPGAIVNVELIPEDGGSPIPVRGSADPGTGCPGIFSLDVAMTYAGTVIGVNVILDQSITGNWNEIDAVQLIGRSGVDEVSAPTAARSPELIITAPGSYQSEIGCPASQGVDGDWAPDCTLSQLFDNDGDGIYTFITAAIPAGEYEAKVALDLNWALNYGADGIQDAQTFSSLCKTTVTKLNSCLTATPYLLDRAFAGAPQPL
ncbi:MAG: tetratricopeptide repeat protein [Anaerolineae bacterium]